MKTLKEVVVKDYLKLGMASGAELLVEGAHAIDKNGTSWSLVEVLHNWPVVKVYKVTLTGWELIWERPEEPKYYWKLKGIRGDISYLNLNLDDGYLLVSGKEELLGFETKFTEEEYFSLLNKHSLDDIFKPEVIEC